MHARITAQLAVIAVVALAPAWVLAQEAKKPVPPNPVGAGGTWSQTVNKEAAIAGEEFDKKQMELIQKVTAYFNQMTEIKGLVRADERRQQAPARQVLRQAARTLPLRLQPAEPAA